MLLSGAEEDSKRDVWGDSSLGSLKLGHAEVHWLR